MTAIWMDGFDHYGMDNQLSGPSNAALKAGNYISANDIFVNVPGWGPAATGPACAVCAGDAVSPGLQYALPTPGSEFYLSFRYASDGLAAFQTDPVYFCDSLGGKLFGLGVTASGALSVMDNNNNPVAFTAGPVIVAENFHFFEIHVNTSTNTMVVRVDDAQATGTPALSYTGGTVAGTIGIMSFLSGSGNAFQTYLDDLFIRNAAGTVNNSWLGDRRIATLFANADTTTSGWTPSYYKEFGAGIARLAYKQAGTNTVQNPGAFISTPAASSLDIGSSDFTLETMIRFDALPAAASYSTIFSRWDTANNARSYRLILGGTSFNNGSLQFDYSTDGTTSTVTTPIVYPFTPDLNVWYHVAIVRVSGELLLFVNGQQLGLPISNSATYFGGGSEPWAVGTEVQQGGIGVSNSYVIGRLDETRFTNGVGRYNAPFTPPSAAFPRGSGGDSHWADVAVLMGYDSGVIDESGFSRTMSANSGAISFLPTDGASVGVYSTVNKATPDDNTFIQAALLNASNILTMTTQPSNGDTVTVGTKDGTTAAVYTFKTALASAFDVLIDTSAQNTLINLLNAINAGTGAGTKYGTGTTSNFDVNAEQLPVGQIEVLANTAGTAGNSIASTHTGTAASWATSTLTGGANIPGPTEFKVQRPPNNTTLISAMQLNVRALKTDAGTADIQSTFIGALGGTASGTVKPLTVSPSYYKDIIETDPDTSGSLTPTTIINGKFEINRTA